jgi:hypothetical protein
MPYALFHTGPYADFIWGPYASYCLSSTVQLTLKKRLDLDVTIGKVSIGGDGSKPISFTSRLDIARYLSFVLSHLPAEQLMNRIFTIAGDTKVRW